MGAQRGERSRFRPRRRQAALAPQAGELALGLGAVPPAAAPPSVTPQTRGPGAEGVGGAAHLHTHTGQSQAPPERGIKANSTLAAKAPRMSCTRKQGGKPLGPQAICAFHLADSPFLCFLVSVAGGYSTYPLLKEKKNKATTENEWNCPQWLDTRQPWAPANEGPGLGLCLLLGCAGERASPPEPGPGWV